MTLDNLLGISLEAITPDGIAIQRLIRAAKRNLQDASITQLSNENRFDMAYKAIMQSANAALQANGFRTLTSKPGHHMTMIQSLSKSVGLPATQIIVLDALRKQRNVSDYSGDPVSDASLTACLEAAEQLTEQIEQWLQVRHPKLFPPAPTQ